MDFRNLPKIENTRASFLRRNAQVPLSGWIVGERDFRLVLESHGSESPRAGEELFGEVHLHQWKLLLRSRVVHTLTLEKGGSRTITVMDPVSMNVQKGNGRERFRSMTTLARLADPEGNEVDHCKVVDVSMEGIGVLSPKLHSDHTEVQLIVRDGGSLFELTGEVRYISDLAEGHRYGIQLQHDDRVMRRKWERFIADMNRRARVAA